jgi:hypothetical protein
MLPYVEIQRPTLNPFALQVAIDVFANRDAIGTIARGVIREHCSDLGNLIAILFQVGHLRGPETQVFHNRKIFCYLVRGQLITDTAGWTLERSAIPGANMWTMASSNARSVIGSQSHCCGWFDRIPCAEPLVGVQRRFRSSTISNSAVIDCEEKVPERQSVLFSYGFWTTF